MKKFHIYVDTSVIGGCFDDEFKPWSDALIEDFRRQRYVAVLSDVTAAEIAPAPAFVRALHAEMLALPAKLVAVDDDTVSLMQHYAERQSKGPGSN